MAVDLGGKPYELALLSYKTLASVVLADPSWEHREQFMDSLGSVVANIAEGEGRKLRSRNHHLNFINTARGSIFETLAWLDCLIVLHPDRRDLLLPGIGLLDELSRILAEVIIASVSVGD